MGNEIILVILMGIFTLAGALIGAVIAPRLNHKYSMEKLREEHKRNIEKIRNEFILKEKIESFKKIHAILYEIKRKTINFITKIEKKEVIEELILELNNECFLFSDVETLKEIKKSIYDINNILNNPSQIVKIENKKIDINKKELEKFIKQMGDAQTKILKAIRKELKI